MSSHYTDRFELNEGWWLVRCNCGADLGVFPDAETACDAAMQHAYDCGEQDGLSRPGRQPE